MHSLFLETMKLTVRSIFLLFDFWNVSGFSCWLLTSPLTPPHMRSGIFFTGNVRFTGRLGSFSYKVAPDSGVSLPAWQSSLPHVGCFHPRVLPMSTNTTRVRAAHVPNTSLPVHPKQSAHLSLTLGIRLLKTNLKLQGRHDFCSCFIHFCLLPSFANF